MIVLLTKKPHLPGSDSQEHQETSLEDLWKPPGPAPLCSHGGQQSRARAQNQSLERPQGAPASKASSLVIRAGLGREEAGEGRRGLSTEPAHARKLAAHNQLSTKTRSPFLLPLNTLSKKKKKEKKKNKVF